LSLAADRDYSDGRASLIKTLILKALDEKENAYGADHDRNRGGD
jgi:hypothetical protein